MIITLDVKFELGDAVYIDGDNDHPGCVSAYIYRGGRVEYEVTVSTATEGWVAVYPEGILTAAGDGRHE